MPLLTVHCYAALREAAGARVELELPAGSTAGELKRAVAEQLPDHAALVERSAVAVNRRLVGPTETVGPEDEIALLPPVSGG